MNVMSLEEYAQNDTNVTYYDTGASNMYCVETVEEVECLENMMIESSMHSDKQHLFQCREVKQAKRAGHKHKKPHLNRRIIR